MTAEWPGGEAPDGTLLVIGHPANGRQACKINGRWTLVHNGEPATADDLEAGVPLQAQVAVVVDKARILCDEELGLIDELPEWHEELAQACEALPGVKPFARRYEDIDD